jgi:hypothetical protein
VTERYGLYYRWHWLQKATKDIDPVYPVMREYLVECGTSDSQMAWLVFLHVAYYHLGSALLVFGDNPNPHMPKPDRLKLPTATERRGHRDPDKLAGHFQALFDMFDVFGGPYAALCAPSWTEQIDRLLSVYGNGRWAAYKTAEMAQKVLGRPIQPTDAQHADSTGPRKGLADVFGPQPAGNSTAVIADLDRRTTSLAANLGETDLGYVETSLCDFHSLLAGHYYLGHDIDAMQAQLYAVPSEETLPIFTARRETLPHEYLGEFHGWIGPDADRKRAFLRTGEILERP